MATDKLRDPTLLAVWPGMGGVAITAGYYLMAKLGMHLLMEFPATDYFDLEQIEVKDGLILSGKLPRSRLFLWKDPHGRHDFIVFIGEAQPPARGGAFCTRLIDYAKEMGVQRVFTFAAMATPMRPEHRSRIFGAAIDQASLDILRKHEVQILESGNINGLNGVLLAMAACSGMSGGCLLGGIPHVFAQIPFPKASLAVLEVFTEILGIKLDFGELRSQAAKVEHTLSDFLKRMEHSLNEPQEPHEEAELAEEAPKPGPGLRERRQIEELFTQASQDRSRAYTLKQALDRLGVFAEYEDRFLDLFKEPE
jgi:proteasome assembly chaperone (PAC2) family protein